MKNNFYANPTGKNIKSSSDCDLEVDDLGFIKQGKSAEEMFGGGGFEPTQQQLDAMNSGITAAGVAQINTNKNNITSEQAKTTGMTAGGTNYITVNGIRVYVSSTAPTGARTGDLWIGG